jgi:hypothetical protein
MDSWNDIATNWIHILRHHKDNPIIWPQMPSFRGNFAIERTMSYGSTTFGDETILMICFA